MVKPPVETMDVDASAAVVSARLADCYGLPGVDLEFLGGELDRNYRVSTREGGTFLAKLRTNADRNGLLQWQKDILLHLADRAVGVAVPTLVRTSDGRLDVGIDVGADRWILTVLNWVSGTDMVRIAEHSDRLLFEIGSTAARVTNALNGFQSTGLHETHHWDVTRSAEVIEECLAQDPTLGDNADVQRALEWFRAVEPDLGDLPKAMVHNDLNDNNVLVDDRDGVQRVAGVLDFNDALYTLRVAEPAIAGAYSMLRKANPLEAMGWVVAGYVDVNPLTDEEIAVAYPLAAARLCVQASTWSVRALTEPTEYGAMRMRHTLPALHRVLQVEVPEATDHLMSMRGRRPAVRNGK